MSQTISFPRPDGQSCPGYLSVPSQDEGAPGIVLFQEWWGIDPQIKVLADRFAGEGFRVLVPDLFRGRVAATGDEGNHLMQGLDFGDAATQDGPGAATYLHANGAKVAAVGLCMGGALALVSAMNTTAYDAVAVFYGLPPQESWNFAGLNAPFLAHWALHDTFFPIDTVDDFENHISAAGKEHEFYRYDAGHAFMNPEGIGNFHAEHAATAWNRTVDFLHRTLG